MIKPTPGQLFDSAVLVSIIAVIAYIVFAGYYGSSLLEAHTKLHEYQVAVGCAAPGTTTNPLMDNCSWDSFTVRSEEKVRGLTGTTYHLSLSNSQLLLPDVEVNRSVFLDNPVGSPIQVECWPDVAIAYIDNGKVYHTDRHPEQVVATTSRVFSIGTLIFFLTMGGMAAQFVLATRKLVSTRPPDDEDIDYSLDMKPLSVPMASAEKTTITRQKISDPDHEGQDKDEYLDW